ncbi:hypothetical protein MP228_007429 [Amoeboaphelidium protococcarum]|nr:hypothetical protein MP228_007429 [Amoeboaphelidium protococcarum]
MTASGNGNINGDNMLRIFGNNVQSPAKISQLLQKVNHIASGQIEDFKAYYVFYCQLSQSHLSDKDRVKITTLLTGRSRVAQEAAQLLEDQEDKSNGKIFHVIPRTGTISPWSSKATDIVKYCGLGDVIERVERGRVYIISCKSSVSKIQWEQVMEEIHDRMTERVLENDQPRIEDIFQLSAAPGELSSVDILGCQSELEAQSVLQAANVKWGLALSQEEITYLVKSYSEINRNPTDAELMMFGQVNSEHCRHKIFNGSWTLDGVTQDLSLFQMIKNTYKLHPQNVLSAYKDNAAVLKGHSAQYLQIQSADKEYQLDEQDVHILCKVETHNHPTAISPYQGASTGSGGEIRDEAAVGCGSRTKAGLCGFTVSNLMIPGFVHDWERDVVGKPKKIASALDIMLQGPLGAAAFNNEFGRPCLTGYFRTFCQQIDGSEVFGYHKPIMIAGGMGNVMPRNIEKKKITAGSFLAVFGGPCMLIGLGGGSASSASGGSGSAELDFASVQRDNPEMQRRAQEVINACVSMGDLNPILSLHDVGAGGLSNAFPELVHDSGMGATFQLREIPCNDQSMSPMQIWCNESQERFVCAIDRNQIEVFKSICQRERCPFGIAGVATNEQELRLVDSLSSQVPIDLPMQLLFGKAPTLKKSDSTVRRDLQPIPVDFGKVDLIGVVKNVLKVPVVASKQFLITIGDRSVTGLVCREQMVGPWQCPVADCAVTATSYETLTGECMAMGERPTLALINPAASARMAVCESLTNLAAAYIGYREDYTTSTSESTSKDIDFQCCLGSVRLSANWMAAASEPGQGQALYEAVHAIGMDLCPQLGISIPVGKDSMSMKTTWRDSDDQADIKFVTSPLSLVVTAYAPVVDVRKTLTPQLHRINQSLLYFVDLAGGKMRLGGSSYAQTLDLVGTEVPDVENVSLLKNFFHLMTLSRNSNLIKAYHDRSDGGLIVTLMEMCFAGRVGAALKLDVSRSDLLPFLLNEELGAVVQIDAKDQSKLLELVEQCQLRSNVHCIGQVLCDSMELSIQLSDSANDDNLVKFDLQDCLKLWSETSYRMQALRDNPVCAQQEYDGISFKDPGLLYKLTFNHLVNPLETLNLCTRPKVAILREQGVNGHREMAYAFMRAGFSAIDVHMTDLIEEKVALDDFVGLAACGGFSYGDVLGAGSGWANCILYHQQLVDQFKKFFQRSDTFALGVCNGCQMLSQLKSLFSNNDTLGAQASIKNQLLPRFVKNKSEQFEARTCMVEIVQSAASQIWFDDMVGSQLPIAVAHGEGLAAFESSGNYNQLQSQQMVALRYVDGHGSATENYPQNPNGSVDGVTGFCSADGRVLIMMPHPERVIRTVSNSWCPDEMLHSSDDQADGPWLRMFRNVRKWVG